VTPVRRVERRFNQSRTFSTVVLYRDDLEEIIDVLESRGGKVEISDDDSIYDTLDDLQSRRGDRIKRLTLKFSLGTFPNSGDLEFDIGPRFVSAARLWGRGSDVAAALYTRVQELLLARRTRLSRVVVGPGSSGSR
jgi:hypothetical protein